MKRFTFLLLMFALVFALTTGVQAAEKRFLPETDLINCGKHFEIIGKGPEATMPVWVIDNPSCYNKQEIKLGSIETHVDDSNNMVYVYENGVLTKQYHVKFDSCLDFDYETYSGGGE